MKNYSFNYLTLKNKITLGTHNDGFHADDVFSTALLKILFDTQEIRVVRTRDKELLDMCDIVYDVGNTIFDHHKEKEYRENGVPYASFGKLWRYYGKTIILKIINKYFSEEKKFIYTDKLIDNICNKFDENICQQIDGPDNGFKMYESKYNICDFNDIIDSYNLSWYEEQTEELENERFNSAVNFAYDYLEKSLKRLVINQLYIKNKLKEKIEESYKNNSMILYLEEYMPWENLIHELDTKEQINYVVIPKKDDNKEIIEWSIVAVSKEKDSFINRKDLPKEWGGLRDNELSEKIGVQGGVFCHNNLFLIVVNTKIALETVINKIIL